MAHSNLISALEPALRRHFNWSFSTDDGMPRPRGRRSFRRPRWTTTD